MKTHVVMRTATVALALAGCLLLPQTAQSFYNPSTGKWLNRDPLGEEDGSNVNEFCQNAPTCYVDKNGLQSCCLRVSMPRTLIEDFPIETTTRPAPAPPGTTMPPLYPPVPTLPAPVPTTPGSPSPAPAPAPAPSPQPGGPGRSPPDQGGPPWDYGKSDCTPDELRNLNRRMHAICDLPRSCVKPPITDCEELWYRMRLNAYCEKARKDINTKCYRGGDATHRAEVQKARDAYKECSDRYAAAGGT
jgi:hypothetical protein